MTARPVLQDETDAGDEEDDHDDEGDRRQKGKYGTEAAGNQGKGEHHVNCCLSIKHLAYVVVTFYSREKAVKNQEHYSPFSFSSNRCNMKL